MDSNHRPTAWKAIFSPVVARVFKAMTGFLMPGAIRGDPVMDVSEYRMRAVSSFLGIDRLPREQLLFALK